MPYKEKRAWLSMLAMAVAFGPYFTHAAFQGDAITATADMAQLWRFGLAVVVQVVILGIGHAVVAIREPADAQASADERDCAIEQRAMSIAYYVLITGMILVGCVMPFTSSGWHLVNAALFMIVLAETVHYGAVAVGYRRYA